MGEVDIAIIFMIGMSTAYIVHKLNRVMAATEAVLIITLQALGELDDIEDGGGVKIIKMKKGKGDDN